MEILTGESVPGYLAGRPELRRRVGEVRSVEMSEQGKINGVFFVRGSAGALVLKQGLPWVRVLPDWPLPAERVAGEARVLARWGEAGGRCVPAVYGFDPEQMVLAMELLGRHVRCASCWRPTPPSTDRRVGRPGPRAGGRRWRPPARLASDQHRAAVAAGQNAALTGLMEEVVFLTPFSDSESNVALPLVAGLRAGLIADPAVVAAVAELRWAYLTRQEALIHGDLHLAASSSSATTSA